MPTMATLQPPPQQDRQASSSTPESPSGESPMPVFDSAGLLQGGREIMIRHGSECYRLRHTRNDKLILTK
jgi:hemin uptake protein HemP